jgi:hypothetical protein
MKPTSKLTAVIQAKPPKEFPEIMAMTTEQLVEKIRLALEKFYSEGLYSTHLSQMERAAVLLTEYHNAAVSAPDSKLIEAVRALYYAAVWHPDRPVDAAALWTTVRDAAGFEPGQSPTSTEVKMIAVPLQHVPAIEATLAYLVK